mgnify:FL=1
MFEVSVIIPVYNADRFVRRAVESAVCHAAIAEVVLVDDAGPDNALGVSRDLEREHATVRLLRHPDNGNHGASASRNRGLRNTRSNFMNSKYENLTTDGILNFFRIYLTKQYRNESYSTGQYISYWNR